MLAWQRKNKMMRQQHFIVKIPIEYESKRLLMLADPNTFKSNVFTFRRKIERVNTRKFKFLTSFFSVLILFQSSARNKYVQLVSQALRAYCMIFLDHILFTLQVSI